MAGRAVLTAEQGAWVATLERAYAQYAHIYGKERPMTWTAPAGGEFQQPPPGTHIARCIRLIDLGTQKGEYQGTPTIKRQNLIVWELPTELVPDGDAAGKPFIISKFYTTSLSEKANLYADLVNWRGKEFSPEELTGFEEKNLLDKTCLLALTENDKQKVRVTGVIKLHKGAEVPPRVNDLIYFSLEPERFDRAVFDALSDGIKNIIMKSPEYAELNGKGGSTSRGKPASDLEEDIPFLTADASFDMEGKLARRLRGHLG